MDTLPIGCSFSSRILPDILADLFCANAAWNMKKDKRNKKDLAVFNEKLFKDDRN
jgi:hypothetical protein